MERISSSSPGDALTRRLPAQRGAAARPDAPAPAPQVTPPVATPVVPPLTPPAGTSPAHRLVRPVLPRRHWWTPVLADGTRPLLLMGDVAAVVTACALTGLGASYAVVLAGLLVMLQSAAGLYRSRLDLAVLDDVPALLVNVLLAIALIALLDTDQMGESRSLMDSTRLAAAAVAMLVAARLLAYVFVRRLRSTGRVAHPTVIVGAGDLGQEIAQSLLEHPEYGLLPIGFLDSPAACELELPVPLLGSDADLTRLVQDARMRAVVLAYSHLPERELVDLIRTSHRAGCEVFVVPRLVEAHHVGEGMESVWGTPLMRLRGPARNRFDWPVKRAFDLVVASIALVLAAPVIGLCALAVRLEGGPGVIFRQERVGCDGRRFMVMKLRTLRPVDETESQTQWNIAHDDRLGPVGRFLRRTSLDELPQLFNILRGEMSLVGPRPERPHFVEEFQARYPTYRARERVPCGLTGWAQIHGLRGDTSISDRARFDNYYIENWSLWLDLKIVLRTVLSLFRSPGG